MGLSRELGFGRRKSEKLGWRCHVWTYMDPARLQPVFGELWFKGHNCRRISGFLMRPA
jgi:hypothetical protein